MLPRSFQQLLEFFLFAGAIVLICIVGLQLLNATDGARGAEAEMVLSSIPLPPRSADTGDTPSGSALLIPVTLLVICLTAVVERVETWITLWTANTTAADLLSLRENDITKKKKEFLNEAILTLWIYSELQLLHVQVHRITIQMTDDQGGVTATGSWQIGCRTRFRRRIKANFLQLAFDAPLAYIPLSFTNNNIWYSKRKGMKNLFFYWDGSVFIKKIEFYFWILIGFFLTFLCLGLAKIEEDANVEKEKLLCWPAKHKCWLGSSKPSSVWTIGSGSTAILLNLRFLWTQPSCKYNWLEGLIRID